MNFKAVSVVAALTLMLSAQMAEARNPAKGGGGGSGGGSGNQNTQRLFGIFTTGCTQAGNSASSNFVSIPGIGQTVQLQTTGVGSSAVARVLNLYNNYTSMLGSIQFSVTGSSINNDNFVVAVTTIPAGGGIDTAFCTVANGRIRKGSGNSYFIGTQATNGSTSIRPGSQIIDVIFTQVGEASNKTNNVYGVAFTGFGGVGYDLSSPTSSCVASDER